MLLCLNDDAGYDVAELFELYHRELLRITAQKLKNANDANYIDDAQDVVQNVYVKLTKYISKVKCIDESEIRGYLYAVAANETVNFLASQSKHRGRVELDELSAVSEEDFFERLLIRERYDRVVDSIMTLDDRYGVVMLFRYAQGYSVGKIARILGISESMVYSRLNTGKKKLIDMLEGDDGI